MATMTAMAIAVMTFLIQLMMFWRPRRRWQRVQGAVWEGSPEERPQGTREAWRGEKEGMKKENWKTKVKKKKREKRNLGRNIGRFGFESSILPL